MSTLLSCRLTFVVILILSEMSLSTFAIRSKATKVKPIIKFSEVVKQLCYPANMTNSATKTLFDDRTSIVKIKNKFYLNGTIEFMHRLTQRQFTYVTVSTIPQSSRTIDYYNFCLFMNHKEFMLFDLLQNQKHCPLRQSDEWKFNMIPIKFPREIFLKHFQLELGIWGLQITFRQQTGNGFTNNGTSIIKAKMIRENCIELRGTFSLKSRKLGEKF